MTADKLELLRIGFTFAKGDANRSALYAPPGTPRDICRYCGKYWRQWAGSKLDGHAQCTVTPEFKRDLAELVADPRVTYALVATKLGVSIAVVRAWVIAAEKARTAA